MVSIFLPFPTTYIHLSFFPIQSFPDSQNHLRFDFDQTLSTRLGFTTCSNFWGKIWISASSVSASTIRSPFNGWARHVGVFEEPTVTWGGCGR